MRRRPPRWRRQSALALLLAILMASCGGNGEDASPTTSTSTSLTSPGQTMQAVLDDLRTESGAPGVLALVRVGDEEWFGSSGSADLTGAPIGESTRFRIGSITKTLTSALVLDAVGRGELSLDDMVEAWVPGVVSDGSTITIRMLLNHTSGIFNAGDEGDVLADIEKISDPNLRQQAQDLAARYLTGEAVIVPDVAMVAIADTHPLYFAPGTGYHYSNFNYHLAAMVLAAATGADLPSLLQERLAVPLGFSSITAAPADLQVPDLHSYTKDPGTGEMIDTSTDLLAVGNGGSGGAMSNAGELLDTLRTLIVGDMLPASLRAEMVQPTEQSGGTYGLGVVTFNLVCGDFLGHGGAIAGTHSLALVSPDGHTGAILAANLRGDPEPNLLGAAEDLLCSAR
jgi:D-alanyl-D-alanine carboxypeptidase